MHRHRPGRGILAYRSYRDVRQPLPSARRASSGHREPSSVLADYASPSLWGRGEDRRWSRMAGLTPRLGIPRGAGRPPMTRLREGLEMAPIESCGIRVRTRSETWTAPAVSSRIGLTTLSKRAPPRPGSGRRPTVPDFARHAELGGAARHPTSWNRKQGRPLTAGASTQAITARGGPHLAPPPHSSAMFHVKHRNRGRLLLADACVPGAGAQPVRPTASRLASTSAGEPPGGRVSLGCRSRAANSLPQRPLNDACRGISFCPLPRMC
jgi:hypothetical protein